MTIVVKTLSDQVFQIVREQIITGQLRNDAPIRQDALANELGVSKIPLREALARLEQDGLLISHANRGYVVKPMTTSELDEIYELRLKIEPDAAAYASTVATPEDRAGVMDAFQRLDQAAASELGQVAIRNREFHTALVRAGAREHTTQLVERLMIFAERYVVAHLQPAGRDARAHHEHHELLEAWLGRDTRKVKKVLTEHIRGTADDLRAQLASNKSGTIGGGECSDQESRSKASPRKTSAIASARR
jgi:DNA-binding GntR family transcriptional regulator